MLLSFFKGPHKTKIAAKLHLVFESIVLFVNDSDEARYLLAFLVFGLVKELNSKSRLLGKHAGVGTLEAPGDELLGLTLVNLVKRKDKKL
jgi:hypothetical protein